MTFFEPKCRISVFLFAFLFKHVIFHKFTCINNFVIVHNKGSKHEFLSNNIFSINILCFLSRNMFEGILYTAYKNMYTNNKMECSRFISFMNYFH